VCVCYIHRCMFFAFHTRPEIVCSGLPRSYGPKWIPPSDVKLNEIDLRLVSESRRFRFDCCLTRPANDIRTLLCTCKAITTFRTRFGLKSILVTIVPSVIVPERFIRRQTRQRSSIWFIRGRSNVNHFFKFFFQ